MPTYEKVNEGIQRVEEALNIISSDFYSLHDTEAKKRIPQDIDDWAIVATAMLFNCPIWTEDKDFFGTGIPTWTSDRIHLYFSYVINLI